MASLTDTTQLCNVCGCYEWVAAYGDEKRCEACSDATDERRTLQREYSTYDRLIIRTPGKFEGECLYVPYFWGLYLNGCADRDDGRVLGFDISAAEKAIFPELKRRRTVKLYQRDDGFVCEV